MIDIVDFRDNDIVLVSTDTVRAKNILSVQLGALEYAPDLGIDLKYFLSEDIKFQNSSFKAYLVEVLAGRGINVVGLEEFIYSLFSVYDFTLSSEQSTGGMVE